MTCLQKLASPNVIQAVRKTTAQK
jgi:hypothetical protein